MDVFFFLRDSGIVFMGLAARDAWVSTNTFLISMFDVRVFVRHLCAPALLVLGLPSFFCSSQTGILFIAGWREATQWCHDCTIL